MGGARPLSFTISDYHHVQSWDVCSRYTFPISTLPLYVLCGIWVVNLLLCKYDVTCTSLWYSLYQRKQNVNNSFFLALEVSSFSGFPSFLFAIHSFLVGLKKFCTSTYAQRFVCCLKILILKKTTWSRRWKRSFWKCCWFWNLSGTLASRVKGLRGVFYLENSIKTRGKSR